MNMQIQELLFESEICAKNGLGQVETSKAALEKFAELIVRECAKVASRAENNDKEFRCMHEVITNHFGVE